MIQSFPESVKKIWNEWYIRVIVLLSLCLQIVLIILGNRRKYTARTWIRVVVWIAYLSADGVATLSLGIISRSQANSCDNSPEPSSAIMAFWAPFLLVHLGGPDTITAFSLEDNELWLRHLLNLLVQVAVAFYVFLRSWSTNNPLTFLMIPVFISGIFKYGERTWVLRSASSKNFRESLIPAPNAGSDYVEIMEQSDRAAQGFPAGYVTTSECIKRHSPRKDMITPEEIIDGAYFLFDIFKHLYADLILSLHERSSGMAALGNKSADAFKMIEIELGIMYDVLYSKASIAHSSTGMFLRSVSFLSTASALVAFWMAIDKHTFSDIDVTITYQLLIGAIFIEIYAGVMLIFSERTLLCLSKHKNGMSKFIYRVISSIPSASINRKRWSGSMAQFDSVGFCVKDKPTKCARIQKLFRIFEMLEKSRYKTREEVTIDLKELIFQQLQQKIVTGQRSSDFQELCHKRGDYVLERKSCLDKFSWSVVEVEFDHSILLWHIATELCYYSDLNGNYQNATPISKCKISKSLSDYMLYLLVMRPLMLPKGIGEIRYRDTWAEAIRFIEQRRNSVSRSKSEACRLLLEVNTNILPNKVKGDRSKSVLFDGCRLAKSLQALEAEYHWGNEEKWDMITQVWIEMLCYAAIQCKWNQHAQQLSQGGELLSHVCLLMTHHGLSEQFRISEGNVSIMFVSDIPSNIHQ